MYLLYLDDSGSAENQQEDYLVLGGIAVFERQVHWITQELENLATTISPADPYSVEFHASEIFSRRSTPWSGRTKEQSRKTIIDVLSVLSRSHDSVYAFACAVHKASFPHADPMEMAFEQLCIRFDLLLNRFYNANDNQRGLIVLDNSSYETHLQNLARNFRTVGTKWRVLRAIADIPLFVDSRACRLIQLADHVSYAVFRYYNANDATYFNVIGNRFDADQGRLHGLMHYQTVNPQCLCPACLSRRLTAGQQDRGNAGRQAPIEGEPPATAI